MPRASLIISLFLLLVSCDQNTSVVKISNLPSEDTIVSTPHSFKPIREDTTIFISGVAIDILIPAHHKADMLVLPGWNFSRKQAFGAVPLTQMLLQKGYRLVMPEMGKSVYASQYFPETRKDWRKYPTLTWVTDTMIPSLQDEYGILREGEKNFIAGISTGGRGVALIAAKKPVFTAGAALSGDYDQAQMPNDNLMKGVYGEYSKFSERWETVDNPSKQVDKIKMPLYLGHGLMDKVVPASQTKFYYEQLHKAQPELEVILNIDENAGHDPSYWLSEMAPVLRFFDEQQGK